MTDTSGSPEGAAHETREERLKRLAEELEEGRWRPDLDALARRLLEREPGLFDAGGPGGAAADRRRAG